MVLTGPQTTAFYTDAAQMALSARTRGYLQGEGITSVDDLAEFTEKDCWKQILENCKYPPRIPDPANPGAMIQQESFRISAKSIMRLKVAAIAVEYYAATDRPLTAGAVVWNSRLKNFQTQWKAIMDLKEKDPQDCPLITKNIGVVKWLEAFET